MSIFKSIWNLIKHVFGESETAAIAFFDALISGASADLTPTGLSIVATAVAQAEASGGTPEAKFSSAVQFANTALAAAGLNPPSNILHGAVEAAVATLNNAQAAATQTVTSSAPAVTVVAAPVQAPIAPAPVAPTVTPVQAALASAPAASAQATPAQAVTAINVSAATLMGSLS